MNLIIENRLCGIKNRTESLSKGQYFTCFDDDYLWMTVSHLVPDVTQIHEMACQDTIDGPLIHFYNYHLDQKKSTMKTYIIKE